MLERFETAWHAYRVCRDVFGCGRWEALREALHTLVWDR